MDEQALIINFNDQMGYLNTLVTIIAVILAVNCVVNLIGMFRKR